VSQTLQSCAYLGCMSKKFVHSLTVNGTERICRQFVNQLTNLKIVLVDAGKICSLYIAISVRFCAAEVTF